MEDAVEAAHRALSRARVSTLAAGFFVVGIITPVYGVSAASLFFSPSSGTLKPGQTISIGIYVESKNQAMNAAQGTVTFPQDLLEAASLSKGGSVMSLWVQEPAYSNAAGTVNFEGIVLNPGYQGAGGKIITVTFKAKASGTATIRFSSGSILANDGEGTNLTSGLGSAKIVISGEAASEPKKPAEEPTAVPAAPRGVTSPTHPDSSKWYSNRNPTFEWPLPSGITGVNILADHAPNTDPGTTSDGLIRSYQYKDVDDGIWYFHIRFRNAKGWGAITHVKFQIDTQKPESFEIREIGKRASEESTVRFLLTSADKLSGIDNYELRLSENLVLRQNRPITLINHGGDPGVRWRDDGSHVYTITNVAPGAHTLIAKAFDQAGNFATNSVDFSAAAPPPPPTAVGAAPIAELAAAPATRLDLVIFYVIGLILLALLLWLFIWLRRRERETRPRMLDRREINRMEESMHKTFDELREKVDEYALLLEKSRRRRLSAESRSLQEENMILAKLKQDLEQIETVLRRRTRR